MMLILAQQGTKYFGGHSDLLCGILVVKTREEWLTVCYFSKLPSFMLTRRRAAMERPNLPRKCHGQPRILAASPFFTNTAHPCSEAISYGHRLGEVARECGWER